MNTAGTKLKPLFLLDIFYKKTDAEHRLTVPELVMEMAERGIIMERKAVYRDIGVLVEFGVDVVASNRGYYLRSRQFELAELRLLASAVQAANFITEERSRSLLKRLAGLLSDYQRDALLAQANLSGVKCTNDQVYNAIEAVNLAIATRERVSFTYYKRDLNKRSVIQRSGQRYLASPYAMIWVQDRYYLVCNLEGRDNLTHFRLDRMQSVRVEHQAVRPFGEVSEYSGRFDAADYSAKCLNMFGGPVQRVTLECHESLLSEVLDRFGEDVPLQLLGDRFTVRIQAAVSDGLINWICQFGERMAVLDPPELREKLKARLEAALKLYADVKSGL